MNNDIAMKKAEKLAFFACFLQLIFFFFTFLLSYWHSFSVQAQSAFFLMGISIWLLCFLSIRQERLAKEEENADKEYASEKSTIFDESEIFEPLSAKNRLKIFKTWIVPCSTLFFAVAFVSISIYLFVYVSVTTETVIVNAPLSAAFLGGFAFFSLLISKYALGMAQQKELRVLRAGGSYLFGNAATSFLCAISVALAHTGFKSIDIYIFYLILLLMLFVGLEMAFNLVLDFYRPRLAGQEIRVAYDSRFLEICSGSKGFLKTMAQMLDYQFGFKVSETWFYQFMEKAIAPLLLFQIFSLYALNCIVIVAPHEQAIIERFGTINRTYNSGIYFKWPWPAESSINVEVKKAHHRIIGQFSEEKQNYNVDTNITTSHGHDHAGHSHGHEETNRPHDEDGRHNTIFTKPHHTGEDFFLISDSSSGSETKIAPVNLMVVRASLTYFIEDVKAYVYNHSNPEILIDSLANKSMTRYFAAANLPDVLGKGRLEVTQVLKQMIQAECDKKNLGVMIHFVGITEIHPPQEVAEDFENVIAAMEEKETNILAAQTYEKKIKYGVEAEIEDIRLHAHIKKLEKTKVTIAEANMFESLLNTYRKEKDVFILRQYLRVLEENLTNSRIIITNVKNVQKHVNSLNLEDFGVKMTDFSFAEETKNKN